MNLVGPGAVRELWGVIAPGVPSPLGPLLADLRRRRIRKTVEVLPFVTRATKTLVDGADETPPPEPPP